MWSFVSVYNTPGELWIVRWCCDTTGSTGECAESLTDATKEAAPTFRLNTGWNAFRKSHAPVFSSSSAEQWSAAASSHTTVSRDTSHCCFIQHRKWYASDLCCLPTCVSFHRFQFVWCSQFVRLVAFIVIPFSIRSLQPDVEPAVGLFAFSRSCMPFVKQQPVHNVQVSTGTVSSSLQQAQRMTRSHSQPGALLTRTSSLKRRRDEYRPWLNFRKMREVR